MRPHLAHVHVHAHVHAHVQVRDLEHEGKWPADFAAVANAHIRARRAAGFGLTRPAASAFLSLDETLAVRLYSGPSFGPINAFLRQIANLTGEHRLAITRHAQLSFASTARPRRDHPHAMPPSRRPCSP